MNQSNPSISFFINQMEKGNIPDFLIRAGIRKLCKDRLLSLNSDSIEKDQKNFSDYIESLKASPLAVHTKEANEQHYELPPLFFKKVLGKNKKYSSAYWSSKTFDLNTAEDDALEITMSRAELKDGQTILELGCGWGSLTLAMAKKFPNSKIIALSNSAPQRMSIEAELKQFHLSNVTVLTRNIVEVSDLTKEFGLFDRVVSVEMFEHLRNYEILFQKVASWLKPDGKCFVHIFTHREHSYLFETEGEDNWMGKYFFTGGQMPSRFLFSFFQKDLFLEKNWSWSGTHYAKTSEAWLENMDRNKEELKSLFEETYGKENAVLWINRWRVFFLACAECFNYSNGNEWGVTHYLFSPQKGRN